jgi:hypothetical protein
MQGSLFSRFGMRRSGNAVFFGFAILFVALVARLALLTRETDAEEIRHLFIILSSPTIRDVLRALTFQMQPALDYIVRKIVWAPLIGQEEREARLVSILYGVSCVFVCYWAVTRYLKNSGTFLKTQIAAQPTAAQTGFEIRSRIAPLLGFMVALPIALNPSALSSSTDARHYIFVMLLSMIWFPMLCLSESFESRGFRWLSLAFCCSHFFALYLVAMACGFEIVRRFLATRRISSLRYPVLLGLSVLVLTVLINKYAFAVLLKFSGPKRDLIEVLKEVWALFLRFWTQDLSLGWELVLAVLLAPAAVYFRNVRMLRAFLFAVPGLLFFLFVARHKSDYPWSDHYFYVFWGLVPVIAALTAEWVGLLLAKSPRFAALGVVAVLLPFVSLSTLSGEMAKIPSIRIPHRNFTSVYQLYAKMKAEQVPIYVLYPDAFSFEIPPYYFRYVSPPYDLGFQARDTKGGNGAGEDLDIKAIGEWIERNPFGLFYLDTRSGMCGVPGAPDLGSVKVQRIESGTRCDWRLENVRSVKELISAIRALKFPASDGFFRSADQWAEAHP